MADTIFCQVEEDLAAFCPEDMRGFSVRLALAPDAARQDEEARTAIGEFLGTLRDVSFAVFRVDGQTATRLAVPTSVVRADPGTPEELAALQTSVAAWICNYSKVEGYLHPSLGEVGTPVTARQDQLGVHQVMLSTASRPAPLPQQVGLATALHVSLHALNHAGVDATRLLILPMGLFGFTAPDTFTLPSAPELGQEVDAPPNPAATVVCRSTIIKPLSEDPTSLLDANTGFFNPVDQSADQSADAHRFLQRLERRGASRLLEALQASFAGAEGLDETGQVLYDLAQSARRRLSVMTPFIDTDGAQRLVGLFRCSGGDVARELIVRSGRTQPLVAVADDLDSLGVRAYDYKLRHSGGWDESFHAKVVRVDDDQCYVGSSNMTESSFSHSLELGFRVSGVAGRRISRVVDAVIGVAQPLILRS